MNGDDVFADTPVRRNSVPVFVVIMLRGSIAYREEQCSPESGSGLVSSTAWRELLEGYPEFILGTGSKLSVYTVK